MTKFDHLAERGPLRKYAAAINDLIEEVRSLRIASGKGYTVKRTSIGTILEVKVGKTEQLPGEGMRFRGEWSATETYAENDVVVVRGGLTGGTYVAIADVPTGTAPIDPPVRPEDGIYWVCLARDQAAGVW